MIRDQDKAERRTHQGAPLTERRRVQCCLHCGAELHPDDARELFCDVTCARKWAGIPRTKGGNDAA